MPLFDGTLVRGEETPPGMAIPLCSVQGSDSRPDFSGPVAGGLDAKVCALLGVADRKATLQQCGVNLRPVGFDFLLDHSGVQACQRAVRDGYFAHPFGPWLRKTPADLVEGVEEPI